MLTSLKNYKSKNQKSLIRASFDFIASSLVSAVPPFISGVSIPLIRTLILEPISQCT